MKGLAFLEYILAILSCAAMADDKLSKPSETKGPMKLRSEQR